MDRYAERTGLGSRPSARRYLWTDAFAVCTFVGLSRSGDRRAGALALELVDRVHRVLGRHRADDAREGWLHGLPDAEGVAHPTRGGLRIGKPLRERRPEEAFDDRLEWSRDGQYFHYLTRWMRALDQLARAAHDARLHRWARELAHTAHRRFTHAAAGRGKRLYWKMSVDLSRPLVASMGHCDPLDGLLTCLELEETAVALGAAAAGGPDLSDAIADYTAMLEPQALATPEPLGLGRLLGELARTAGLLRRGGQRPAAPRLRSLATGLAAALVAAAETGLAGYLGRSELAQPASRRLPYRELGLSIGLAAVAAIDRGALGLRAPPRLFERCAPLRAEIEAFWLCPAHRAIPAWTEHEDLNDVMLAASLAPEGWLTR